MAKLAVCVSVLLLLLAALTDSSLVKPCCTDYDEGPVPLKALKSFVIQDIMGYCDIEAVIFKTIKNRFICGNPTKAWVQRAMKAIPQKL